MNLKSCHREKEQEYPETVLGAAPGNQRKPERTRLGPLSLQLLICVPNLLGRNYKAGEVCVFGWHLEGRDIWVVL